MAELQTRFCDFDVRSVNKAEGKITGYLSTFNDIDSYGTYMKKTAFDKFLREFAEHGYLPALWQHDRTQLIGRWIDLHTDDKGLIGTLQLTLADPQAQIALAHAEDGSIRGFSVGFMIESEDIEYDKVRDAYGLDNVDLKECSLVTFPANTQAQITNVKQEEFIVATEKETEMEEKQFNELSQKFDNFEKSIMDNNAERDAKIENLMREISTLKSNALTGTADAKVDHTYEQQFHKYMTTGVMTREDPVTPPVAGNEGVPAQGGYLVPDGLDKRVIELLTNKSVTRQNATIITPEGNKYARPYKVTGLTAGWVAETGARTQTDAQTYQQVTAELGELYAFPLYTQRFLADSWYNIQEAFIRDLADAFVDAEETAFISGNGTNKPKGILTYTLSADGDKTRTWNNLQGIASGSATDVTLASLIKAKDQLNTSYRAGAKWYMNTNTYTALQDLLKDSTQRRIFGNVDVATNAPTYLLGYPIEINEYLPNIASGSNPIVFGDMKAGYAVLDRPGIGVVRDDLTQKPYIGFYSIKRVGGLVQDYRALKVVHVGTALS